MCPLIDAERVIGIWVIGTRLLHVQHTYMIMVIMEVESGISCGWWTSSESFSSSKADDHHCLVLFFPQRIVGVVALLIGLLLRAISQRKVQDACNGWIVLTKLDLVVATPFPFAV